MQQLLLLLLLVLPLLLPLLFLLVLVQVLLPLLARLHDGRCDRRHALIHNVHDARAVQPA